MTEVIELAAWIFVFVAIMGVIIFALSRLVRRDSTNYDMEHLWEGNHQPEELELKERR